MSAVAKTDKQPPSIPQLLNSMKNEIARALPKHMSPDRMARIAMTEMRKNKMLADCDPISFMGAIIQAAQLGLEPGSGLGHCYLIPFRNKQRGIVECNLITGYKGLMHLARNTGKVVTFRCDIVRLGDDFSLTGDGGVYHEPRIEFEEEARTAGNTKYLLPKEPKPIIHVYAEATMANGGKQCVVLNMDEVERARAASKNTNKVWDDWFEEMAKKTAVRRLAKFLPQSPEMVDAGELDTINDEDRSQGLRAILDADYTPKFEHADATTIPQVNEEMKQEAFDAQQEKYAKTVKDRVEKLGELGVSIESICKFLKVKDINEVDNWGVEKLKAAVVALAKFSK